jgi:hypothetical protein
MELKRGQILYYASELISAKLHSFVIIKLKSESDYLNTSGSMVRLKILDGVNMGEGNLRIKIGNEISGNELHGVASWGLEKFIFEPKDLIEKVFERR